MKLKLFALLLVVALVATACHGYVVHPGSVSVADSHAYDALIVAQGVIDASRAQAQALPLASPYRAAFDKLVEVYNLARTAQSTYHAAAAAGSPNAATLLAALTSNLTDLNAAIAAFKGAKQ